MKAVALVILALTAILALAMALLPKAKALLNTDDDYQHMRDLERITPHNPMYERMKRDGKH